jgi:D-alanine-D-alanine ligase
MKRKTRVGILFGGRSAEHEVSIQSAKNIVAAVDRKKYEPVLIGIDKAGRWSHIGEENFLQAYVTGGAGALPDFSDSLLVSPCAQEGEFLYTRGGKPVAPVDVVFPVLHGTFGEDGTIQGLLKLSGIPFVGADVLGTAVGMDKDVMKRVLRDADIPIPGFLVYPWNLKDSIDFDRVKTALGMPLFVKPANLGSSVGIAKVREQKDFEKACTQAFAYDTKIIIEEAVEGREIECSVLGNELPEASLPGEVKPRHEFYSYDAKYIDSEGAELIIPAALPPRVTERVRELAVKTFSAICCEGLARVDFFIRGTGVRGTGEVLVNEINTLPGFTAISMYPKLWAASGVSQTELIDRLITLALQRAQREKRLNRSYS